VSWLEFHIRERDPKRKTDIYDVVNQSNLVHVGIIKWYGGFRKYTFQPTNDTIFDDKCLREIARFITALMNERKEEQ
jgi:hypothetical protein